MAESRKDKIKFRILKALDVSGFMVFDPVVRLAFGEDPRKQVESICKYIVIPVAFVLVCVWVWTWMGPRHKTKSGEVPTPDIVMLSLRINDTIADREKIKAADFKRTGEERLAELAKVQAELAETEEEVARLKEVVAAKEAERASKLAGQIGPVEASYEALRGSYAELGKARTAEIASLSEQLASGGVGKEALIAAIRQDSALSAAEREELRVLKARVDAYRSDKYKPLEQARMDFDRVSDKAFFLKTRIEFLDGRNQSVNLARMEDGIDALMSGLESPTNSREALKHARDVIRAKEGAERLASQEYASAVTIYHQIKRSLFTVFIGFFMAAIVAIPVGIMCGLNKIFMACMTPIISIFKPVSPVVWLLIFQIVVGAFFPDPATHPLFKFLNALPFLGELKANPALIFSACTVAMCAVWPALVNTALGVSSIDKDYINVARVLRLGFWSRLFKIVIPSALPLVFAGLRISLGVGWMVLIAAEALSSSDGLGKFVWDEYQNGSSFTFANIIMVCFVVGIIGFFLDRMMILLQRLVSFDGGATV